MVAIARENTWAYSPGEILPEKALKPFPLLHCLSATIRYGS
jgi:hypothetical protein